jgi:hypothetical protein
MMAKRRTTAKKAFVKEEPKKSGPRWLGTLVTAPKKDQSGLAFVGKRCASAQAQAAG